MKLIVGLGNPGRSYFNSRHNIGFSIVKTLAKHYKLALKRQSDTFSLCAKGRIGNQNVVLALPLTFMNLSGRAVGALLRKYRVILEDLLVVCDDLDLEFGRLKLRGCGSSGGHKGLHSTIDVLGGNRFCRLRIGIGRPRPDTEASGYVLSPFTSREKERLAQVIEQAGDCCRVWVQEGLMRAMNIFNQRRKIK